MKYPIRSESHQLEELSERFFRNFLPKNWVAEKPIIDYGVDLRVDLFEGLHATGLELLVQLKASQKTSSSNGESEIVSLRVATYNLLSQKLQVAMLVKFVESDNEAYWIMLKDIPAPPQDQESFAVYIPKNNRLTSMNWQDVQSYVRNVTDRKLAAMRAHELNNQNRS